MNRKTLSLGIFALTVVVALSSCSRQNLPEFAAGRFNHKEKNKQMDETAIAVTQGDKMEPISNKKTKVMEGSSSDKGIQSVKQNNFKVSSSSKAITRNKKKSDYINDRSQSSSINEVLFKANNPLAKHEHIFANKQTKRSDDDEKILLVILAILLPPLAVYLLENDITTDFWIDLILTCIFWIPGVIYALYLILR